MWSLRNIVVRRDGRLLLSVPDLDLQPGALTVLLGPNGAGKTTLLRAALLIEQRAEGLSELDGRPLAGMSANLRARHISYLAQKPGLAWPMRVRDVVALGRFAHSSSGGHPSAEDMLIVDEAIAEADMTALSGRRADTLSGGEEARMHLARGFAARTPWLVADEPTSALDPGHQHMIMKLFKAKAARGIGIVLVLHDLTLASLYADHIVLLHKGLVAGLGPPESVLTSQTLGEVYGIDAHVNGRVITVLGTN